MSERTTTRKPQRKADNIQTIRLEAYDDVVSIRDRLQFVELRRALLILPEGSRILHREIDLLLIQREAARRKLLIALMTTDPIVAENANKIHLSAFTTLRQARSRRWKRANTQLFVNRNRPQAAPHPYDLMSVATRLKPQRSAAERRTRNLGRFIIGLVLLFFVGGTLLAIIPSATVTITPAVDALNEPILMVADPALTNIDVLNSAVPAETIQQVVPGAAVTVESTGRRDAENSLARGEVIFTNETELPIFIPVGTIVSAGQNPPVRFRTLSEVALAAALGATNSTEVIALEDSSGLNGNVQADEIRRVEGALETQISVRNPDPTFGGGLVQEAIVTQADHDRLLTLARQSVQQTARTELLVQLPGSAKFLVPGSIRLIEERPEWTIFSAQVGEAADSVTLDMRGLIEAVVVDELQTEQLAFILLSRNLPDDRKLDETSLTYTREVQGVDEEGRIQFRVTVQGDSYFAVNTDQVAERINGMSVSQAQRTLENELLLDPRNPPQISTFPFDIGRLPLLPVRIHIVVNS